MKRILFLLGLVIAGCGNTKEEEPKFPPAPQKAVKPSLRVNDGFNNVPLSVVIIDSCEYLSYDAGTSSGIFSHKGNCKNCHKWMENMINQKIEIWTKKIQESMIVTPASLGEK